MGENIFFLYFQHFNPFLSFAWQIIYLKNVDVYTLCTQWGGEYEKVCFVHSFKC